MTSLLDNWKGLSLDELAEKVGALPKEARDELVKNAYEFTSGMKWIPQPGPQTESYYSEADILLYGGTAGSGKSDLILGIASTVQKRSLIMRQQYNDLDFLTTRAIEMQGSRLGFNGSNPPSLRTADGRFIQWTGAKKEGWMGTPFDFKAFDEAVQIPEDVIRFHLGWLRTAEAGLRTRAILTTNPPTDSTGDWIIPMFGPWLDLTHPDPAKPGELRWYCMDPDGKDFPVPGPEPYLFPGQPRPVTPMSRTFIPAKLADNVYYARGDYGAKLDAMPEPYRSAYRDGNFMAFRQDQENQVLPVDWVMAAQKRWEPGVPRDMTMTAMGVDVGAGGKDRVVLAPRYGEWFAPLITVAGKDAPDGSAQAALITKHRRDSCAVVVDVGGGYGGDCVGRLKDNGMTPIKFNGSEGSAARTKDGSGRIFVNKRAEAYWRFREALNPDQPGGSIIALPDDAELRSELTAVTFIPDILKVQIESKIDVKKRLGRSPDKADAVVMAFAPGDVGARRMKTYGSSGGNERPTRANIGYSDIKRW